MKETGNFPSVGRKAYDFKFCHYAVLI